MSKTLTQMQNRVCQDCKHDSTVFRSVVTEWINEGKDIILSHTNARWNFLERSATLAYTAGLYKKELPSDFYSFQVPYGIYDETNDSYLEEQSWNDFLNNASYQLRAGTPTTADEGSPSICAISFEYATGTPDTVKKYLIVDPPCDASITIRIHYYRNLSDLSSGSDTWIGTSSEFDQAVIAYAIYRGMLYNGYNSDNNNSLLIQLWERKWKELLHTFSIAQDAANARTKQLTPEFEGYL